MPYLWSADSAQSPDRVVVAWPNRSLPPRGFAAVILGAWAMLMIPALAFTGTAALWGLLPFLVLTISLIWYFLRRSYEGGRLREVLRLGGGTADLLRSAPGKPDLRWRANSFWVEVSLHRDSGPVQNYLTLRGGGRTVEFGAFLSPEEHERLFAELQQALATVRRPISAGP